MNSAIPVERPTYILISEAARILAVTPQTLRVWERSGRLTAMRLSGGVRAFDRSDVERLAAERATGRTVART